MPDMVDKGREASILDLDKFVNGSVAHANVANARALKGVACLGVAMHRTPDFVNVPHDAKPLEQLQQIFELNQVVYPGLGRLGQGDEKAWKTVLDVARQLNTYLYAVEKPSEGSEDQEAQGYEVENFLPKKVTSSIRESKTRFWGRWINDTAVLDLANQIHFVGDTLFLETAMNQYP